ncbi:hypothetical protein SAMN04488518_11051 [Pseudovibrio ascidiaceicola]|uniref:Uncharacterized protein n=1 Tax=Pseudovibrio ascidiaceicola TaxID=285279 RepID=A0A1I4CUH2_9HYPH|nr:hypothetical protein [Pseudovibrio ascidiaceicola]SFK84974.1 hypothetical protein SAMN04488518_11051 [Pseudovibrio ascidiaceicola]
MIAKVSAVLFSCIAVYLVLFHMALVLGMPWGALTMGGFVEGSLPLPMRAFSLLQAFIAVFMACSVLKRGEVVAFRWPTWSYWLVIVICTLSVVGNAATSSDVERQLGLPVTIALLVTALLAGSSKLLRRSA